MRLLTLVSLAIWAAPVHALEVAPPGARLTAAEGPITDSVILPRAPYAAGADPPVGFGGRITRRAWRLPGRSDTPMQILAPIEAQLAEEGYDIVFACSDADCGGFDFRFQLSLLPAPAMFVDLGDYRYILAERQDEDGARLVSIVASRAGDAGTLHVTEVAPLDTATEIDAAPEPGTSPDVTFVSEPPEPDAPSTGLIARIETDGHAILSEIDFPSGAASLPDDDYPTLDLLARWMEETPDARLLLVGHTDAIGSLAANTELSRRRAASVAARIAALAPGAADRISSAGAGYLAPVATNLTDEGRAANRRVEVVLLSR